jgi:aldose 1-epimerase
VPATEAAETGPTGGDGKPWNYHTGDACRLSGSSGHAPGHRRHATDGSDGFVTRAGAIGGAHSDADDVLPPSGRQLAIGHGSTRAVVTEVGGSVRELTVGDESIIWPYPIDAISSGGRGQVLCPWPNRVEDGAYEFDGVSCQAALDEPEHHNAIHGLVRWLRWSVVEESTDSVRLGCVLAPQPGYRWRMNLDLTFTVTAGELRVTAAIVNQSSRRAPLGLGFHPYLDAGPGGADRCSLRIPALQHLVSDERGLPRQTEDVAGTSYDFREAAPLLGVQLDDCYTGLTGDVSLPGVPDGAWAVELTTGNGRRRALWAGGGFGYVMCYTGDTLAPPDRRRAVAVEPMTCPPNALRTGQSLIVLPPGGRWAGDFGIRTLPDI